MTTKENHSKVQEQWKETAIAGGEIPLHSPFLPSSLPAFYLSLQTPLAELNFKSADRRAWKTQSVGVSPL